MNKRRALLLALAALAIAWGSLAGVVAAGVEPVLGLDLQGGFSVTLTAPEGTEGAVLNKAVEIMRRRIEALGSVQEPEISVKGDRNIEVQLPGVTDRERALNAVGSTGELSFRQVLEIGPVPDVSPALLNAQAAAAAATTTTVAGGDTTSEPATTAAGTPTTEDTSTSIPVTTVPAGTPTTATTPPTTSGGVTTTVPVGGTSEPATTTGTSTTTSTPATTVAGETTTTALPETTTTTVPLVLPPGVDPQTGITIVDDPSQEAWLREDSSGLIYHVGAALVLGSDITGATAGFSGGGTASAGGYVVDPDFTSAGGRRFEEATKMLAQFPVGSPQRRFAIVLDGNVVSAPQVAEGVTPEQGLSASSVVITIGTGGADPQAEAEDLATVLRYGALPTTFERSRVEQVSATLGDDSLRAGLIAGFGGLVLVVVAMVFYYRALGLINVVGLSVFGSILLVVFSLLGKFQGLTLTLAGVAGIIVSIGITSDSYIVYFERVKDEVRLGRALRSAVDHAFVRSFRTILTADAVSLAGAGLLWLLAIGPVRGFAIALGLATLTDVAVAYFFTRPATAWLVRTRLGEGGRMSVRGAVGHVAEVSP